MARAWLTSWAGPPDDHKQSRPGNLTRATGRTDLFALYFFFLEAQAAQEVTE